MTTTTTTTATTLPRLSTNYFRSPPHPVATPEAIYSRTSEVTHTVPNVPTIIPDAANTIRPTELAAVMDKVRKRTVRYSGGQDVLSFLERTEELANAYGIDLVMIPRTLSELLTGQALVWYRCNRKTWSSWGEFKKEFLGAFLPHGYYEHLEDTVRERRQGPRELFRDYVISLQDLMRQVQYSELQKLERIYKNCRQEYQLHIKRREFADVNELLLLAGDFEAKRGYGGINPFRLPPERNRQVVAEPTATTQIDPRNSCWRCGQVGHSKRQCNNPRILFCWECGKQGLRTIECCRPRSGNEAGVPMAGQRNTQN